MSNIRLNLQGLERLKRKLSTLDGTHHIPLEEFFGPGFMRQCSRFQSFQEMLDASPFTVTSAEDFGAIPDLDWDAFVRQSTRFSSWQEMRQQAALEWTKSRLLQ